MARVVLVEHADLVRRSSPRAEIHAVAIVDEREDAAADRDPRRHARARPPSTPRGRRGSARPAGRGTACRSRRFSASSSAGSCRASPPIRRWRSCRRPTRCARASLPSTARGATGRAGWRTSAAGWACAKPSPRSTSRNTSVWRRAMSASLIALGRRVAEIATAVDHLLGRAAADAELQPPAGDQVGGARVLHHVERVLVAHVDDRGAELDASWSARRRPPAAGRASRAGGRSDARGSRPRRRRAPRRRPRARSIAAGHRRAERVCDCGEGVQWPNERKPIFFMGCVVGMDVRMRVYPVNRTGFSPPLRPRPSRPAAWARNARDSGSPRAWRARASSGVSSNSFAAIAALRSTTCGEGSFGGGIMLAW